MKFSKIKWNGKKAVLDWTVPNGEVDEQRHLECKDEPLEGFTDALDALKPHVARIIGAPKGWVDGLTVTQVSLDEDQDGRRGFIFTARKDVAHAPGPFHFNTPRVPEGDPDAEGKQERVLDEEAVSAVDRLIQEAKGYVEGRRAQGELPLGQGGEGGEGGGEEEEPEEENPEPAGMTDAEWSGSPEDHRVAGPALVN